MAVELAEVTKIESVMDVGCATGRFYRFFKEVFSGVHYRGFDISQSAIDHAKNLYPETEFSVFNGDPSAVGSTQPDLLFCRDVVHHQTDPKGFLAKLYATPSKYLLLRVRTREIGETVFDIDQSCQLAYNSWVPYIVFNTKELTDLLSSYSPRPAKINIARHPNVLGGQLHRYLPKELYYPETATAETSILIEKGSDGLTAKPQITSETRVETRVQELRPLYRLAKKLLRR